MNAEILEDLKAERLQSMLKELGPAWTLAELQELLAELDCDAEAALPEGTSTRTKKANPASCR